MGAVMAEYDFTSAIQSTSMPSDAEIMKMMNKLNIDKKQKQELFEETKKNLAQMYYSQDAATTNEQLNKYYELLNDEQMSKYIDKSTKREVMKALEPITSVQSNTSKK
jgi:hypothetical protein